MARILIAEDSPVNQSVYAYILENAQHEVLLADNGLEAWERFQNEKVDLVITDISMPEMDGPTFLSLIRRSASGTALPVVMLTGIGADLDRLQDICGCRCRPYKADQLLGTA
jgi:CheY-like chemotaxis protein